MNHYIYIPGLGDHFDSLRKLALRRWKNAETKVTFVPMRWANKHETFEEKYGRIARVIERTKSDKIVLVGESAGGAMALLAFSRHMEAVDRVITVCGYNHDAEDVNPIHKTKHPAFYQLMPGVDEIVAGLNPQVASRITNIFSMADTTVVPKHSQIEGAKAIILHTPGHFSNIARTLLTRYPLNTRV